MQILDSPPSKAKYKKWALGTTTTIDANGRFTVTGLAFKPKYIIVDIDMGSVAGRVSYNENRGQIGYYVDYSYLSCTNAPSLSSQWTYNNTAIAVTVNSFTGYFSSFVGNFVPLKWIAFGD